MCGARDARGAEGTGTMDASVDAMPRGPRARPEDTDRHVGRRIRERRLTLGVLIKENYI